MDTGIFVRLRAFSWKKNMKPQSPVMALTFSFSSQATAWAKLFSTGSDISRPTGTHLDTGSCESPPAHDPLKMTSRSCSCARVVDVARVDGG